MGTTTDKKEAIFVQAAIAPLETKTFSERIKGEGTIEQVRVRFFQGQQLALRVRPLIMHHRNKQEDVITYPENADQFLSGDDDYLVFDVVVPVSNDDEFILWVQNTDVNDTYHVNTSVIIDYYGGKERVV